MLRRIWISLFEVCCCDCMPTSVFIRAAVVTTKTLRQQISSEQAPKCRRPGIIFLFAGRLHSAEDVFLTLFYCFRRPYFLRNDDIPLCFLQHKEKRLENCLQEAACKVLLFCAGHKLIADQAVFIFNRSQDAGLAANNLTERKKN
uniref:Putative secreted protein n=1 Tax=Ixodes ricinus TaxID=34613 RepID=A0A6B0UU59_IXORI